MLSCGLCNLQQRQNLVVNWAGKFRSISCSFKTLNVRIQYVSHSIAIRIRISNTLLIPRLKLVTLQMLPTVEKYYAYRNDKKTEIELSYTLRNKGSKRIVPVGSTQNHLLLRNLLSEERVHQEFFVRFGVPLTNFFIPRTPL